MNNKQLKLVGFYFLTTLLVFIALQSYNLAKAQTYQPPIGIPAPTFGIDQKVENFYTRPNPWNQETAGWYFVNQYHANASDSHTYGTPDNPRATIPDPVPAGSVVHISGTYDYAPTGYDLISCEGTSAAPVFIVGDTSAVVLKKWAFKSTYTIIENIEFTGLGKINIRYPSHHIAIRYNELHNMPGKIGGRGESDTERVDNIVIYDNKIHSQDGWNADPDSDLDNHGIKFDAYVDKVWVLDNVGYHNGGSFLQIGNMYNGDLDRNKYYYVGRNLLYENRQSPIEIKQSSYIFISENVLYNNYKVQNNIAGQAGIYVMYGPAQIWIINNRIYNSNFGVAFGSNSGGGGQNQYIIGNLMYNIHMPDEYDYNVNTGWSPAAIMMAGGWNRYIVNNTIYDTDAGINVPGGGKAKIINNIISQTTRANHILIESGDAADSSEMYNNLLYQAGGSVKIRWGSNQIYDVAAFETANSVQSGSNLEAGPLFADSLNNNYWLQEASPAINSGIVADVYQTFSDLYGTDIRQDIHDTARPYDGNWDIGAYEFKPGATTQYTLTIGTEGSGNITLSPSEVAYSPGDTVTLTAIPDEGWQFDGWSGDVTATDSLVLLLMTSNKTVTANFSTQTVTSLNEIAANQQAVYVYPNPVVDKAIIVNNSFNGTPYQLSLLNAAGRELRHWVNVTTKNVTIGRSNLPAGIYYYQIYAAGQQVVAGKILFK